MNRHQALENLHNILAANREALDSGDGFCALLVIVGDGKNRTKLTCNGILCNACPLYSDNQSKLLTLARNEGNSNQDE